MRALARIATRAAPQLLLMSVSALILFIMLFSTAVYSTICRNNTHTTGSWRRIPQHLLNHTHKSFHCCGWDNGDWAHDTNLCGTEKVFDHYYQGSNAYFPQVGGHGCTCDAEMGRDSLHEREKYYWDPEFCSLLPWNATQFCELLGTRKFMLVGDSTGQQAASTLMALIHSGNGTCATQIHFGRSDNLIWANGESFEEFMRRIQPDIVMLNTGAHCQDPGDCYTIMEALLTKLPAIRSEYQARNQSVSFVWRTIQAGHTNCSIAYSTPLRAYKPNPPEIDYYHWNYFPDYDAMAKSYSVKLNFSILDMSPLYLRPDGHTMRDCLHFCMPGPLDIFPVLLLGMFYNNEI